MSLSVILACLWVLAATVTALLPYRRQFPSGIVLLLVAPAVIAFLGYEHGAIVALIAVAGFVSMFRRPLGYLARKALRRERKEEGEE
ncbi:MAG: DUF2484 family protein [Paracoccaceae bacterium]|nr:DUF2484 family protein [Paracoccaceae bacterium]